MCLTVNQNIVFVCLLICTVCFRVFPSHFYLYCFPSQWCVLMCLCFGSLFLAEWRVIPLVLCLVGFASVKIGQNKTRILTRISASAVESSWITFEFISIFYVIPNGEKSPMIFFLKRQQQYLWWCGNSGCNQLFNLNRKRERKKKENIF